MTLSVIIPTKDRPDDLQECLASIARQTLPPKEVLIVDDGELSEAFVAELANLIPGITLHYIKKSPPDLAASRNLGAREASAEIVLFLDDDVIPDKNYIEEIWGIWQKTRDPAVAAVGGVIGNHRRKRGLERFFEKLFFLSSRRSWDVTDWGFQIWDPFPPKPVRGFYCYGGISSYRRDVLLQLPFRSLSPGRTALEDVDWCLRAKKLELQMIVTPAARLFHKTSRTSRDAEFTIGVKEGYNRSLIFATDCPPNLSNRFKFWVASAGWILKLLLAGWWSRAFGIVFGRLRFRFAHFLSRDRLPIIFF